MQLRLVAASLALLMVLAGESRARAQCGAQRSTCSGCHDGSRAPYEAGAAWHVDHAFTDLCVACHGGDGVAVDAAAAHVGVDRAIASVKCEACHEGKASASMSAYQPVDASKTSAPTVRSPHGAFLPNAILSALALALALGVSGLAYVARKERSR